MSYPRFGPADLFSTADVAATVSAVRPDWRLVDADPIPEGSDVLYRVTVATADDSERDAVLKCFRSSEALSFRTHPRFLVEVDLLELVGRETDLPVPEVCGVCESREGVPTPAFLMEPMPGETVSAVSTGRSADAGVAERFVRESGRSLARIHDLRSFETFGNLVARTDDSAGADGDRIAVEDGRDEWVDRLRDVVTAALDGIDERFADLEAPLRRYADDRLESLDLGAEPALLHGDYRPGNLLADPATGELTAVLDWGAAQAGDPRYELAWAVREFSERAPVNSPDRRRVRETLFDAYESERCVPFDRDAAFERRQRFYLSVTWITELQSFDLWWAGADESVRAARAEQLRENVESLF